MIEVLLIEPPPLGKYGNQRSKGAFGNLKTDIRWPPIDLTVIAGHLRKNGVRVHMVDAGGERISLNHLIKHISISKPGIVIINTSTTTIYNDLDVVRAVRQIWSNTLIGAIGVHVMALPEETLEMCQELDFVAYSEPEIPILNLTKTMDLSSVKGIFYRKKERTIKNLPEAPIQNMDELGIPAHDLVPLAIYQEPQQKRKPMTITMVSRGCINKCTFCSSHFYGKYRLRSVENVMEELRWITRSLGVKELKFYDDGITYDYNWAKTLFDKMIDEKIDLTWNTNIRADSIDLDLARLMKKAGCHTVNMGLETGDQDILDNVNKNITLGKMEQAVKDCKEGGLEVTGYFVVGLPGESRETVKETVIFAKRLDLDLVTFNIPAPHPGTPFFNYLKKNGYLRTEDWSKYDTNSVPVYDYPDLSGEEIYYLALRAYRHFYMRPQYFWKRIKRISSFMEVKNLFNNFIAFMKNFILKGLKMGITSNYYRDKL